MKVMKIICFAILTVLSLALVSSSFAEDISVSASLDKKVVPVGDVVILTIYVKGSQSVSAPALPDIDGFQTSYLGPMRQTSIINGRSSTSMAHRYSLLAMVTGQFTIPPIEVKHEGKTYQTNTLPIRVIPRSDSSSEQKNVLSKEDLKEYVYFSLSADKKTAYLNEGVPVLLRLHVREGMNVQLYKYPKFPSTGFSVLPFEQPMERNANIGGSLFRIIDFKTTVYPVRSGELTIGPAELACNLIIRRPRTRRSLFPQQAKYPLTLESEPYTITVKPLPSTGQPKSFSGAVGQYDLNVEAKPTKLKVGEPITLTMIVQGQGNIDIVNMPEIADMTQFKAYDPQVNVDKKDNSGRKVFEQVLVPTSDSIEAIPEIRFSYFDPKEEQYKTHIKGPIPIQVESSDAEPLQILEVAGGKAVKRGILGRDIVSIKDETGSIRSGGGYLYTNKGFLALQLLPLLGFAAVLVYQKRRDRFATDRAYARQYHAPRKAKKGLAQSQELMASGQSYKFCSNIFKTMQEYLGDRFNLPSSGITIEVVDSLRSRCVPEDILEKLSAFFQMNDRMRFTQCDMNESEMKEIMDLATESIELLEARKNLS